MYKTAILTLPVSSFSMPCSLAQQPQTTGSVGGSLYTLLRNINTSESSSCQAPCFALVCTTPPS